MIAPSPPAGRISRSASAQLRRRRAVFNPRMAGSLTKLARLPARRNRSGFLAHAASRTACRWATTASARPTRIAPAHGRFGPTEEAAPGSATSARAEEAGAEGPSGWKGRARRAQKGRARRGREGAGVAGGAVRGWTTTRRAWLSACARELWRADWATRVSIIWVVADTKRPAPMLWTGKFCRRSWRAR